MTRPDPFVTATWLAAHRADPDVIAVDGSFFLPDEGRDAEAEFLAAHIPGAVRFDIDAIADHATPLPHMLPDAAAFGTAVGALGIGDAMTIVVYDSTDLLGGARVWWMFDHFGARDVRLLEGGLRAWTDSGAPVESGPARRRPRAFQAHVAADRVETPASVLAAATAGTAQIVDARSAARFSGSVAEPRPGLRAGHIPGARNVPWRAIVDATGHLKSSEAIADAFQAAGVDIARPIITTCGSGVSAAVLALGLARLGAAPVGLYDGSWSEWGGRHDLPIETGPAKAA